MENNNRQGCRWVKCSDRLPEDSGWYCIKNFSPSGWVWFDAERKSFIHHNEPQILHGNVLWLSESIEPCATSSENGFKEECERLAGLVKFWQEKYYELNPPHKNPKIDNL